MARCSRFVSRVPQHSMFYMPVWLLVTQICHGAADLAVMCFVYLSLVSRAFSLCVAGAMKLGDWSMLVGLAVWPDEHVV